MLDFNTSEFGIVYPNKKYEFKNKGMPIQRSNNRGNLYLEFEIDYPKLTDEQRDKLRTQLMETLSQITLIPVEGMYVTYTEHQGEDFHLSNRKLDNWRL